MANASMLGKMGSYRKHGSTPTAIHSGYREFLAPALLPVRMLSWVRSYRALPRTKGP